MTDSNARKLSAVVTVHTTGGSVVFNVQGSKLPGKALESAPEYLETLLRMEIDNVFPVRELRGQVTALRQELADIHARADAVVAGQPAQTEAQTKPRPGPGRPRREQTALPRDDG